jgi:hypothetical protein
VKFSAILGNPVYDKNLHLKILKDVIKHLEDDGICVWLHPARWIQDPLAPYKGKRSDYGKFKDLPWGDFEIITRGEANRKFNIKNDSDLVISTLNPNSRIDINPLVDKEQLSILEKVQSKMKQSLGSLSEKNKINGIRVPLKSIVPLIGSGNRDFTYKLFAYDVCYDYFTKDGFLEDGKYWTTRAQKNQYTKSEGATSPLSIEFNTENEARNFINSTNTEVYKFINIITKNDMHTQLNYLPFLGDYSFEWDNNDISSYFDFNSDEVNYIMNNIKNYT